MKIRILALVLVLALLCGTAITVSAVETPVSVNDVVANVGDTVKLAVSVDSFANIQAGSVAVAYDSTALELVSGNWTLPNNPGVVNFDTATNKGAFSYLMTSSVVEGAIFEAEFKVLDGAAAINEVEFTVTLKNSSKETVVDNVVVTGCVKVGTSPAYIINDHITVFEADVLVTPEAGSAINFIKINKGDVSYNLLSGTADGKTVVANVNNKDEVIYTKSGDEFVPVDVTALTEIAVVYNDVDGTVRCYVNENIAHYDSGDGYKMFNGLKVSDELMAATGAESVIADASVTLNAIYNIGKSGTSEVVAFQEHNDENSVRILAGVDMPWYTNIGFEVEVYKDGVGQGVEVLASDLIYSGVYSNGDYVEATEYGYNYFAAIAINDVDVSDGSNYYINVKPFTKVGEATYYGSLAKIIIDQNGNYGFAE